MDKQQNHKRVAAIVPAYNEARRLGRVLSVLVSYPQFHEVLVVDDGSTDGTKEVALAYGVRVIRNEQNSGKGHAMDQGVKATESEIIFFCDADITGLTHSIINEILTPVKEGATDMFVGMRNRKIYYARLVLMFIPLLGGERAITRELWERIPQRFKERFKIETALNFYATHHGQGFLYRVFPKLGQTIKEKKYGWRRGMEWRIEMYQEIISANVELHKKLPSSTFWQRMFHSASMRWESIELERTELKK